MVRHHYAFLYINLNIIMSIQKNCRLLTSVAGLKGRREVWIKGVQPKKCFFKFFNLLDENSRYSMI